MQQRHYFHSHLIIGLIVISLFSGLCFAQSHAEIAKLAKELEREYEERGPMQSSSQQDLVNSAKKYRESLDGLITLLEERKRLERETLVKKRKLVESGLMVERDIAPQEQEITRLEQQAEDTKKRIVKADQFMQEVLELVNKKPDFMAEAKNILAQRKRAALSRKARSRSQSSPHRRTVVVFIGLMVVEDYGPRRARIYRARTADSFVR